MPSGLGFLDKPGACAEGQLMRPSPPKFVVPRVTREPGCVGRRVEEAAWLEAELVTQVQMRGAPLLVGTQGRYLTGYVQHLQAVFM